MSIKDQCNNCRYHVDKNCTPLAPTFDGTSYDVYIKRINLEKDKEELAETTPVISDNHDESSEFVNTGVGGSRMS